MKDALLVTFGVFSLAVLYASFIAILVGVPALIIKFLFF